MEEFGGHKDPGERPSRDGVPVLPGDENPTCDSCTWCRGREIDLREQGPPLCWSCYTRDGATNDQVKRVNSSDPACAVYHQRKHTLTYTARRANRRREKLIREADMADGAELTERQRRDDAELDKQDRKLGR